MKKKIILGIFFTILFFYFLFFLYVKIDEKKLIEKKTKIKLVEKENIEISEEQIESSNIMEDVSYSAKDVKGNEYFLKANEGIIDQNESNYIFLKSVKANIKLENYKFIEISSDFGKYNINNYDTIFKGVILENNIGSLKADVIEMNVETKNIKIFMYEEDKKVNIKSLNQNGFN